MKSIPELLLKEGFVIQDPASNLTLATTAFFAARAIAWIRERASSTKFDLQAYLIALTYYKLGLAQLKFSDDGELLYRYLGGGRVDNVHEITEDDDERLGPYLPPPIAIPSKNKKDPGTTSDPE